MRVRLVLLLLVTQVATVAAGVAAASPSSDPGGPVARAVKGPVASEVVVLGAASPVTRGPAPTAPRTVAPVHRRRPTAHRRAATRRVRAARLVVPQVRVAKRPQTTPVELTAQQRLDNAVARIPGYRSHDATWLLQADDGHWGTADWYRNVIWISPAVPADRVYDVVVHEWSHLKAVQDYGGDVGSAVSAMNRYFGGQDLIGAERAADCMARLSGATWTHYTDCSNSSWRAGAARLLRGEQL